MTEAKCPSCKAPLYRVRPIRIAVEQDDLGWRGRTPAALGFVCVQCGVLLPLSATTERDDATDAERG